MTEKTRSNALEPMRSIGQSEDELMNLLVQVPLASIGNLASMYGGDRNRYGRELQKMEDNGLVVHSMEGYSQRRQNRYCAVDLAPASPTGTLRPLFPALVGDLRIRVSLVESVYQIVAQAVAAEPQRKLEAFQWRFDEVLDAGAWFNDGWMGFKWSGIWQKPGVLNQQVRSLYQDLRTSGLYGARPYPGIICLVVPDSWQAEMVRRAIDQIQMPELFLIHNVATGHSEGGYDLSRSRGRPPAFDTDRWSRQPDRLHNTMAELLKRDDSTALIRILSVLEQWPGCEKSDLRTLAGLNGRATTDALEELIQLKLVWRTPNGGYAVEMMWLNMAARRDRVWAGSPGKALNPETVERYYSGRIGKHEKGLTKLIARFADSGCPIAQGRRFRDVLGRVGQIAPDAMVYIEDSPFGPTWCYVEYELSVNSRSRAKSKLNGYRSRRRSDDFPVLMVCRPKAAPLFLEERRDLRMLVAATEEVRKGPIIGQSGTVWR